MTAKEYLSRYWYLKQRTDEIKYQIQTFDDIVHSVTPNIDGIGGGSGVSDKIGKITPVIMDLCDDLTAKLEKIAKERKEIEDVISQVYSDKQKIVLEKRYLSCKTYEQIASEMNYDVRQIYNIHKYGLIAIEKILKKKTFQ